MDHLPESYLGIRSQINELRGLVPQRDLAAPDVSGWSVGMHVHHCGLTMNAIAEALIACAEPTPSRELGPRARTILETGRIPRGVAEAPDIAIPTLDVGERVLEKVLGEAEAWLDRLPMMGDDCWYRHFALGVLAKRDAMRFMIVHNAHHLAIVAEVLD